jgi:hypothetical protein
MLALRLAVGQLGQPMPAFDLALRRYWDANHPGDSLEGYLRRSGFLRRFAQATNVPDQVQVVLGDIASWVSLPGTAASLVGHGLCQAPGFVDGRLAGFEGRLWGLG